MVRTNVNRITLASRRPGLYVCVIREKTIDRVVPVPT
jgi:hypothetical protein